MSFANAALDYLVPMSRCRHAMGRRGFRPRRRRCWRMVGLMDDENRNADTPAVSGIVWAVVLVVLLVIGWLAI